MTTTILSFDIGIRNLAWCCMSRQMDISGSLYQIKGWENVDLLATPNVPAKQLCSKCSAKATHTSRTCARHCPADKPALRDLSGVLMKKVPNQSALKILFAQKNLLPMPKTRTATLEKLATIMSLPLEVKKQKKAVDTELSVLHDAIRSMVQKNKPLFQTVTEIHLENQPVLKNPTMKTVQILLYATLRDSLQPNPPTVRLIHAGVKVKGKPAGDKGYKERKQGSEAKAAEAFQANRVQEGSRWKAHLDTFTKQNDLTDAFCMCMDALSI